MNKSNSRQTYDNNAIYEERYDTCMTNFWWTYENYQVLFKQKQSWSTNLTIVPMRCHNSVTKF